jgi:AcrR family transcriptional regulator
MLMFMRPLPGSESRIALDAPPASVTRESAHADQRRRILRAVDELVGEQGYGELTVELIIKQARVSYKTFYKHFSDKEDCLVAHFDDAVLSTEREIRKRLAVEPLPWPEQVALALGTLIELIVAQPIVARAVIVEAPAIGPGVLDRYEHASKALVPLFREGRKLNPRGGELPSTIEATLAGSVFWSIYQRLVVGEAERLPELLPELTEPVLRTYVGQAEASRIARADTVRLPALASA